MSNKGIASAFCRMRLLRAIVLVSFRLLFLQSAQSFTVKPVFRPRAPSLLHVKTKNRSRSTSSGGGFGTVEKVSSTGFTGAKALRKSTNAYDRLKKENEGNLDCCRDLYVRSPLNNEKIFWFVGKLICDPKSSISVEEAALAQKRLILDYAKLKLRPNNFGGKYSKSLEIWLAPGDSEMDTVQNKVSLVKVTGSSSDLPENLDRDSMGYNPEIYVGEEIEKGGLRVERDENGDPTKPVFEVNESM